MRLIDLFSGIFPFNADAVAYNKIVKNAVDPPAIPENVETLPENIAYCILEQIIAQLDDGILMRFERCAENGDEWDGDDTYSFMYQFWLKCKEQRMTDDDEEKVVHVYTNINFDQVTIESESDAEQYEGESDDAQGEIEDAQCVSDDIQGGIDDVHGEIVDAQGETDDVRGECVWELDGQRYLVSDAHDQLENKAAILNFSVAEIVDLPDLQPLAGPSGEMRNARLVKKPANIFQILENSSTRNKIKVGQRKQRARVERACIPSSSMNIRAKKRKLELKAEKAAEIERKKLLRVQKKTEKSVPKKPRAKSFIADDDETLSNEQLTDESTAESTLPTSPVKSKRSKYVHQKSSRMIIESSDSDE